MGWCEYCCGLGSIECECGGDQCVCGQETIICPKCRGESDDDYNYEDDAE